MGYIRFESGFHLLLEGIVVAKANVEGAGKFFLLVL
jgi:hypothetical protein